MNEPSTTIHCNIRKLENEGAIRTYKAVLDYEEIDEGFCAYVLTAFSIDGYGTSEGIAIDLDKSKEVESVDVVSGSIDRRFGID